MQAADRPRKLLVLWSVLPLWGRREHHFVTDLWSWEWGASLASSMMTDPSAYVSDTVSSDCYFLLSCWSFAVHVGYRAGGRRLGRALRQAAVFTLGSALGGARDAAWEIVVSKYCYLQLRVCGRASCGARKNSGFAGARRRYNQSFAGFVRTSRVCIGALHDRGEDTRHGERL